MPKCIAGASGMMTMTGLIAMGLVAASALSGGCASKRDAGCGSGCGHGEHAQTAPATGSQAEAASSGGAASTSGAAAVPTPASPGFEGSPVKSFTTPDGLEIEEFKVGEGLPCLPGAVVTVHFVGRVKGSATAFQNTREQGEGEDKGKPETHPSNQLLPGLRSGIVGMRVGGLRRITIPPEMGFGGRDKAGEDGKVVIPAGSTLVFDVELVGLNQRIVEPGAAKTGGEAEKK